MIQQLNIYMQEISSMVTHSHKKLKGASFRLTFAFGDFFGRLFDLPNRNMMRMMRCFKGKFCRIDRPIFCPLHVEEREREVGALGCWRGKKSQQTNKSLSAEIEQSASS